MPKYVVKNGKKRNPEFSAVRFLPFLAHMGLFSVISGVLEGIFAQICGKEWEKRNLLEHQK